MKLIQIKCPSCGAQLDATENQKKIKCQYCNTTTFLDDEIIQVKHTIYSGEKEEELKNAEALLKLKEYAEALEYYQILSKKYIYEADIWYALVLCLTEEFTNFELADINYPMVNTKVCREYIDKYQKLETNETLKNERLKKYNDYEKELFEICNSAAKKINDEASTRISIFLILGLILLIPLFLIFFTTQDLTKEEKKDEITIESFFNNSSEYKYELQEVKSNGSLCYHFSFYSDNNEKEYRLKYYYRINGSDSSYKQFDNPFKNGDTGWVCWNLDKDENLEVGEYKIYLYLDNGTFINMNSIEVVE